MPTIVSHAAVPLALGWGFGPRALPAKLVAAGILASILPDVDTVGMRFGVDFLSLWGHRGLTHSILGAGFLALLAACAARRLDTRAWVTATFVFVAAASHGLLDMATNGGSGIALFWPFSPQRLFFAFRPIAVSPFDPAAFLTPRGGRVIVSELLWVWLPCLVAGFALFMARLHLRRRREGAGRTPL